MKKYYELLKHTNKLLYINKDYDGKMPIYHDNGFDFDTMKVFYHFADWFDGALIEVSETSKAFEACRQLMEVEVMQ